MGINKLLIVALLALFSVTANAALLLDSTNALFTGTGIGQLTPGSVAQINEATGLSLTEEIYKDDGSETGILSGSYETSYGAGNEWATISLSTGATGTTLSQLYAFVKDGNNDPFWYLWDLTALEWNGTTNLEYGNSANLLWPTNGSISHVSIFSGTSGTVPEPATLALFGLGLLGFTMARRRRHQ